MIFINEEKLKIVFSCLNDLFYNSPIGENDKPYISDITSGEFNRLYEAFKDYKLTVMDELLRQNCVEIRLNECNLK